MRRLATAIAAAGTICALGANVALAAPAATWSHPSSPVPGAFTNDSPAMATVNFPAPIGQGLMVAWRGTGVIGHIHYRYRTPAVGHWSHMGTIPGLAALTSSAPAIGGYFDPLGKGAVLAVWAGHVNNRIWYSQGQTLENGTITWTTPVTLPTSIAYSTTFDAPTVFFPDHSNNVMVVWRAPFNHVRYSIGPPVGRGFTWSQSAVVPGNPPTPVSAHCTIDPCTSDTPAVTEETTSTSTGQIFVFWKQLGTTNLFYSTAVDGPSTDWPNLTWTGPTQVPGAITLLGPAASIPTVNATGPLLLVYKAPFSAHMRYQTLSGSTWSGVARVYGSQSDAAPALLKNVLATTTPGTFGNIILRVYG